MRRNLTLVALSFVIAMVLLPGVFPLLAQDGDPTDGGPFDLVTILAAIIVAVVPTIVAAVKKRMPNWLIPVIATLLGGILQFVNATAMNVELGAFAAVAFGLASVGLRSTLKHWLPGKARDARKHPIIRGR